MVSVRLPNEWVEKADGFLGDARRHVEDGLYWLSCFEAQQAAELYLKALILSKAGTYPFTHDLAELLTALRILGFNPPTELYVYADALTGEYTMARYPGTKPRAYNRDAASRCVEYAERIARWVREAAKDP